MDKCKNKLETSVDTLKALSERILKMAKAKGAQDAEVALSVDKGISVNTRLKEVETLEYNHDKGVGLTVFVGKRKASVSSSDTSDSTLEDLVERAVAIAKISDEDEYYGLADSNLLSNDYPELSLYHPWNLEGHQAIDLAVDCETLALDADKRIVNSEGVSVSSYEFIRIYGNTHGFVGGFRTTRHSKSCVLLAQDKEGLKRDYDYTTSRYPANLLDNKTLASSTISRVISRLNARKIATQKTPVIFSSDVSNSLLNALISAISGTSIYRGTSFLRDALNSQVLPSRYRIFEVPHIKGGLGSAPYDGEGVLTRDNVFVDEGILKQYVLGSYSARRLGLQTTANAGGVHNLTINHDALSFDDLIKKMHKGLVVTELMGQGVNLVTGDYSRGVSGFWVEDGEIQYPIHEVTVAGNLKDMLLNIEAVADDSDIRKSTKCGSVLIREMMVAGN